MYGMLDKAQRRTLILNFTKMKSEDEFILLDEKELFHIDDVAVSALPQDHENVQISISDDNLLIA